MTNLRKISYETLFDKISGHFEVKVPKRKNSVNIMRNSPRNKKVIEESK